MKRETELAAIMLAMDEAGGDVPLHALHKGLKPLSDLLPAPDLQLPDLDEGCHDIQDYRGKVVLVNFWATWYPRCRMELPTIQRLARKLHGEDFAVLAVNVGEQASCIRPFAYEVARKLSFPILLDAHAKTMEAWQVRGLPTSFLLDRQGHVAYTAVGGRDFEHPEVERIVRALAQA